MKNIILSILTLHVHAALKFLTLNDVHLNMNATGMPKLGGNLGKDFLDFMLKDAKDRMGDDFDAILFAGDNCDHGSSVDSPGGSVELMNEIFTTVTERVSLAFPGKLVLNSIGNNDVWKHNFAPSADNKTAYYLDMWSNWF